MVRLEREGDSFVLVTGSTPQKQDIGILINALSELKKNPPDTGQIKEGISYLENSSMIDIRKELKILLQKALDNKK